MGEFSPMMTQYKDIKDKNTESLLFFRLGDFYELFFEDAKVASRELDLVLTGRNAGLEERVPMCGVPYHSCESYIARLVAKGYKVAICEQLEDPATAQGIVKRDIVRTLSPGTVTDASMLDEKKANYIAGIYTDSAGTGLVFIDVSTGECRATDIAGEAMGERLFNELARFSPSEAVLSAEAGADSLLTRFLSERLNCCIELKPDSFDYETAAEEMRLRFGAAPEPDEQHMARAIGGLLAYLKDTQKNDLKHINKLEKYSRMSYMELDQTAFRNLEISETMLTKERRGSLLWVLDKTVTSMGSRLLRGWIEKPLASPASIRRRQMAVGELAGDAVRRGEFTAAMRGVTDMERLISRVIYGTANCRDLRGLCAAAELLPDIKKLLQNSESLLLSRLFADMDCLDDIRELISAAIVDEPPFSVRDGGMIREGYDSEADRLRYAMTHGRDMVAEIERAERDKTGIKGLRVGYNKVFGYYIEVTKSYVPQVPEGYIRKQTLANCERYITEDLKKVESEVLTAEERIRGLEYELFVRVRENVAAQVERIQKTAAVVAECDVITSLAEVADKYKYVCPEMAITDELEIKNGRHPVVERMTDNGLFVPNDTKLDCRENRIAVITGPNMAGKSTYMRQVALIVLMAQIGSFVPADSARLGVVDRIFTRVGASDDLASGRSTFMVEMSEVSEILRNATSSSLLILDEIGRGTSTFDGMAIARAVLEHIVDKKKLGAKALFATHYHELTALEATIDGVKNYNVSVKKRGDDITFLRKIIPGGADNSYGVEVARLAGLPDSVVRRAREILSELEAGEPIKLEKRRGERKTEPESQPTFTDSAASELISEMKNMQLDTLTPIEALNVLYKLKNKSQSI